MKNNRGFLLFLSVLVFSLNGCGGGGGGGSAPPPATGSITGTLSVSNLIFPASAPISAQQKPSSNNTEDFVPGEIIVRFNDGVDETSALAVLLSKYHTLGLVNAGPIYPRGPYLLRTGAYQNNKMSRSAAKQQTKDTLASLRSEPGIKYAELNGISHAQMIPNDPAYTLGVQWDMSMINLPTAWEITTGSPSVIVAVLDTGIRPHPDLDANVLSTGYNFVDMNSNPSDPLTPFAEFHGTHVAGTIGAIGNNGVGMAGVAWHVKIMPVRVLGSLGDGNRAEIINGMLYAAGLPNSSHTVPPQRANVINMSLAGSGSCTQDYQEAINQVTSAGVVVVAAAGNSAQSGNPVMNPASCQGVIAVGAVGPDETKASYSESQPYVFIAAPGGEEGAGIHEGILSALPSLVSGSNETFKFMQGTSMAAPHVSGVVALMFSVNPSLTPTQVANILAVTASPLGGSVPNPDTGYGLLNAGMAVAQAKGVPIPAVPIPYPFPSIVDFKQIALAASQTVSVFDNGGSALALSGVTSLVVKPTGGNWLSASLDPSCSSIAASSFCQLTVNINPAGLPADQYYGAVLVTSNAGVFAIPVIFQVGASPSPPPLGPMTVQLWGVDSTTHELTGIASTITTPVVNQSYNYTLSNISPGCYAVVAGIDTNGDGVFGDAPGEVYTPQPYQENVCVTSSQTTSGIDFSVSQELGDIIDSLQ